MGVIDSDGLKEKVTEIILNAELCDSVRKVITESPCDLGEAVILLGNSKNISSDADIVINLTCKGYGFNRTLELITLLNK